jgi:hypothetical protein
MSTVREYQRPLIIVGGAIVVLLIIWVALVSPENSKLSSLQAQTTTLQGQEATLQAKLTSLQSEGQKLSTNCVDLQKITTQIPSVQTPTDVDAEESSFESQFNALAGLSGVSLALFGGFTPASATATGAVAGAAPTAAGVTAVPTTLTIQGNYSQVSAFINGLDSFPRLFVIQKFILSFGSTVGTGSSSGSSGSGSGGSSSGASGSGTVNVSGPPLWVGGQAVSPTSGPYNLNIEGSIYYTSTPSALAACSKATAAESSIK